MKKINKVRLTESQLHKIIKESVKRILENYPPGAQYDSRAPWNQEPNPEEDVDITVYAYYTHPSLEEGEEEREEQFDITVRVSGSYDSWGDFEPDRDELRQAAQNSDEIPQTLEGGWTLSEVYLAADLGL